MKLAYSTMLALKMAISSQQIEDLLSGFYSELFSKGSDFNVVESCLNADSDLQTKMQGVAADLQSGDITAMMKSGKDLAEILNDADMDFANHCPTLKDDSVRFWNWT